MCPGFRVGSQDGVLTPGHLVGDYGVCSSLTSALKAAVVTVSGLEDGHQFGEVRHQAL